MANPSQFIDHTQPPRPPASRFTNMPRGRPARDVPCADCIRRASSSASGPQSTDTSLCANCVAKLQANTSAATVPDPTQELEYYSRLLVEAINQRDFNNAIWNVLDQDIQANYLDYVGPSIGRQAHVDNLHHIVTASPEYFIAIGSVRSTFNVQEGTAEVHIAVNITGRPSGGERESWIVLKWRRRSGSAHWLCVGHFIL